jgi:hypothetical protein
MMYSKRKIEDEMNPSSNFFIKKYRLMQNLIGPKGLQYYMINNKVIIMFEDIHVKPDTMCNVNSKNSIWIDNFLLDLFKCSPVYIDYFQETYFFRQLPKSQKNPKSLNYMYKSNVVINKNSTGMERVNNIFHQCLGPIKTNCSKYGKVRFHNIEFRRFIPKYTYDLFWGGYNSLFSMVLYYLISPKDKLFEFPIEDKTIINIINNKINIKDYNKDIISSYINNIDKYYDIINNFIDGDMKKLSKNMLALILPFKSFIKNSKLLCDMFLPDNLVKHSLYMKIHKQLKKLDKNMVNNIRHFIEKEYNIHIQSIINNIKEHDDIIDFYNSVKNLIHHFSLLIFDLYTISRLLKSIYKYKSSIIVLYAGLYHIERYNKFINMYMDIDNNDNIRNSSNINGCIDLYNNDNKWQNIITIIENQFNKN